MNPSVQVNVDSSGGNLDTTATWQVRSEYDDSGIAGVWGPFDLATARSVCIAMAGRTNVRKATIEPVA